MPRLLSTYCPSRAPVRRPSRRCPRPPPVSARPPSPGRSGRGHRSRRPRAGRDRPAGRARRSPFVVRGCRLVAGARDIEVTGELAEDPGLEGGRAGHRVRLVVEADSGFDTLARRPRGRRSDRPPRRCTRSARRGRSAPGRRRRTARGRSEPAPPAAAARRDPGTSRSNRRRLRAACRRRASSSTVETAGGSTASESISPSIRGSWAVQLASAARAPARSSAAIAASAVSSAASSTAVVTVGSPVRQVSGSGNGSSATMAPPVAGTRTVTSKVGRSLPIEYVPKSSAGGSARMERVAIAAGFLALSAVAKAVWASSRQASIWPAQPSSWARRRRHGTDVGLRRTASRCASTAASFDRSRSSARARPA